MFSFACSVVWLPTPPSSTQRVTESPAKAPALCPSQGGGVLLSWRWVRPLRWQKGGEKEAGQAGGDREWT